MLDRIMMQPSTLSKRTTIIPNPLARDRYLQAFCLFLQMQTDPEPIKELSERILEVLNGPRRKYVEHVELYRMIVHRNLVELKLWLGPRMPREDTRGIMPTLEWYGYLGKWLAYNEVSCSYPQMCLPSVPSRRVSIESYLELSQLEHLRGVNRFRCVLSKTLKSAAEYVIDHAGNLGAPALRNDTYAVIVVDLKEGGDNGTRYGFEFQETRFCKGVLELVRDPNADPGEFSAYHAELSIEFALEHKDVDTFIVVENELLAVYLTLLLGGDASVHFSSTKIGKRDYFDSPSRITIEMEAALMRRGIDVQAIVEEARGKW